MINDECFLSHIILPILKKTTQLVNLINICGINYPEYYQQKWKINLELTSREFHGMNVI